MGERECIILFGRLCLNGPKKPTTLQALADKINLSRERVRQIETKALRRLKIRTKMNKKEIVRLHRQIEELEKIILS